MVPPARSLSVSDKGSHARASALETRATAKAGLDHPFASVALVANLETVTANARLCNRPLPPAVASASHPATRKTRRAGASSPLGSVGGGRSDDEALAGGWLAFRAESRATHGPASGSVHNWPIPSVALV